MLSEEQSRIIKKWAENNSHDDYHTDYPEVGLTNFFVAKGVLRPENSWVAYELSKLLKNKPDLYHSKRVLDMGCGSGIQGIICALNGAEHVTFSDISQSAVDCTGKNIENYRLRDKTKVMSSDLFGCVDGRFDILIFNHPFLIEQEDYDMPSPLDKIIFSDKLMMERFFKELPYHSKKGSILIMPFSGFCDEDNSPAKYAERFKLKYQRYDIRNKFGENYIFLIEAGK